MLTQRQRSIQIVESGGESVFPAKENQPQWREDSQTFFEPETCVKGFSAAAQDFRSFTAVEKGHGRIGKYTITVSTALKG